MNYSSNTNGSKTSSSATASSSDPKPTVTTLSIRVPKNVQKKFNVMKFNGKLNIDFSNWTKAEMTRENNSKEFNEEVEESPEFGAGSEFGRKERDEARRKRFRKNRENYKESDQPWILQSRGDSTKKYKGDREGGVGENASYYVFTHGDNGTLEAYPLEEWYNFQSIQRFKTLTSEEAEEEYSNRTKCLNLFSIMLNKSKKNDSDEEEEINKSKTRIKKTKNFKVSEMDEQIDSSSESSDEESNESEEENLKNRKKKAKNANSKKKPKRDTEEEALEDSDDGDDEGRECDYISSDSSESEPEYSLHGVSEEKGLKVILNSDEDDSEDDENEKESQQNVEQQPDSSKKSNDFSSDSDTYNNSTIQQGNKKINEKEGKELVMQICKNIQNSNSSLKRKQDAIINEPNKKLRTEYSGKNVAFTKLGITEEVIRKYLTRKPTTLKELISKFKLHKLNNEERKQAEAAVALILNRITPKQEIINANMYFSL